MSTLLRTMVQKLHKPIQTTAVMLIALSMVMALTACGSDFEGYVDNQIDYGQQTTTNKDSETHKIGVSMPTKDLQRWIQDGQNMEQSLRDNGFTVDLQYADNTAELQAEQVQGMVAEGCEVLVIAAVDGKKLTESLAAAKDAGIVVIAYDRLIMDSDAVSYYASFDNEQVGKIQGEYIEQTLDLKNTDGPYNIELFTGSPDDNNCKFFFGGAMKVLQPYIDAGKLIVPSGQTSQKECSTQGWSTDNASKRMKKILSNYYSDGKKLDAVLSSNDSVANGIVEALTEHGQKEFPVLTGQDCDINSVKDILKGRQSMSIFKDTRDLAAKVSEMVIAVIQKESVPINDTTSYDNGTGVIPSFVCEPVFADADNYQEILLDSGYYTEDQLK